uniref:Poly [ADP-ribose] polymerase n=1 Tax=Pyxicephalus adspersus TaxID=30357 RepID=A0AAV3AX00_PYXAD|nr:TPA: hypothetical protein GDO54_005699 [Pyxicephalus adspersus]
MERKVISQQHEAMWSEDKCQNLAFPVMFSPIKSSNLNIKSKVVAKYKIAQYKISELVWDAIKGRVSSLIYNGVQVKINMASWKVYLVGKSKEVTKIMPIFKKMIEETTREIEKKTKSLTVMVPISQAHYDLMCKYGLEKGMTEKAPELKIDYSDKTNEVQISGLRYEVLSAKHEITKFQQEIQSKCIQVDPLLAQFLMLTGNEKLSSLLFVRHNIIALLEINSNTLKVTVFSEEIMMKAEKTIKEELLCRRIFVGEKSLLETPEWKILILHMNKKWNAEICTVLILEFPSGATNDVVITGLTSNVQECHQKVSDFLKDNTTIRADVPVWSKVKMQFIQDKRRKIWEKIQKKVNVKNIEDKMCLSGPRVQVQEAELLIRNFLSSLHCDTLRIDKPGAKKFCMINQKVHVATAKEEFNCAILFEADNRTDVVLGDPRFQVKMPNGLTISVYKGDLSCHNVDVIVNAANENLQHIGGLAKVILNAAGRKLQDDCNIIFKAGGKLSPGDSVITGAGNLPCKQVIHTVGPQWSSSSHLSYEILRKAITNSLHLASKNGHCSIAIPAVSSISGFPLRLCIENIMEAIRVYVRNQQTTLQKIHLVDMNEETVKIFCEVTKAKFAFIGAVTTPSNGVHEMTVGSVTYQVKIGDITKEDAEIIVNSSNNSFTLRAGLSKAILEAAGKHVEESARKLGSQPNKGYIITQSGNLGHCKWIVHVAGASNPTSVNRLVLDVLQECEKHQVNSVAFPALGTGAAQIQVSASADSILDAVVDFTKSRLVSSLKTIKVILFQQDLLNDFYESMKKREEPPAQHSEPFNILKQTESVVEQESEKLNPFHAIDGAESVMFMLCADKKENLDKTKTWLQQQIESAQTENVIREECISEIEEPEVQRISDLQNKFQVSVILKPPDPSIRITGLTQDVMAVSGEIEMIIKSIKEKKAREREAELIGKLVEWRYEHADHMVPFEKMANLELEEAKNEKKTQITIQIPENQITVNLEKGNGTDKFGNQIQIQREIKNEKGIFGVPKHWKVMHNTLVMEVDVPSGTPEYSKVEKMFQKSCQKKIVKILRVQNQTLWLSYQIKKLNVDKKNNSIDNERMLFHGTDSNSIQHINHNGFNRSYAGRNAAAYGNGTYFAVNASYSAQDTYSKPDVNGQKHMYLARVLTGVYCTGKSEMIAPSVKNPENPTDLYDSVTDKVESPSIFVIFNDIQAYPEYHIVFQ